MTDSAVTPPRFPYGGSAVEAPIPGAAALEVIDLRVSYPDSAGPALCDVSLTVPAGRRVALVGANGSGKSTLLKAVAGLLTPDSGSIRIGGRPAAVRRARIAYLAQRGGVDWRFPISVRGLVRTGRYVHLGWLAGPRAADEAAVELALSQLGLAAFADRQIGDLSGGQQQRVLLARALAQDADLLLLDEPLNAVDAATREEVDDVLTHLQARGKSVVMATHDLHGNESGFDGAFYLAEGRLVEAPCEHALEPVSTLANHETLTDVERRIAIRPHRPADSSHPPPSTPHV